MKENKLGWLCGACGTEFEPPVVDLDGTTLRCPMCFSTNIVAQTEVCSFCGKAYMVADGRYVPRLATPEEDNMFVCSNCESAKHSKLVDTFANGGNAPEEQEA